MKMKRKAKIGHLTKYYYTLGICWILILLMEVLKSNTTWIEHYYAQKFYPAVSYVYIILFSWIPISVGDVFYATVSIALVYLLVRVLKGLFKWNLVELKIYIIRLITLLSALYVIFYLNWGLNYYRLPMEEKIGLQGYKINKEDHLMVLDKYIQKVNNLRKQIDVDSKTKNGVRGDIKEIILQDSFLNDYLCKSQVLAKSPLSSEITSTFTVSGYFNPFTLEAQVNELIPNSSYPFVLVHELSHQMGVGFEDECNFVAFLILHKNKDLWYQYSAYYAAVEYLLMALPADKELLEEYKAKLSPQVLNDFKTERDFWLSYRGWVDTISSLFYNQFLKHNNQPEGLARYNRMATLLVAWEKSH